MDRNTNPAGVVKNGDGGRTAECRSTIVQKLNGDDGGIGRDAVILRVVPPIAGDNRRIGSAMAEVVAFRDRRASLQRLIDLGLGVDGPFGVGIVRGLCAAIVRQIENVGDAGRAIGISKIIVLPVDAAIDHGKDHAFAGDVVLG